MFSLTFYKSNIIKYSSVQLISKGLTLLSTYSIAILSNNTIFGYVALLQATLLITITCFGFNLQSSFVRYYFSYNLVHIIEKTKPIIIVLATASLISTLISFILFQPASPYFWFSLLPIIGFLVSINYIISIISRSNNKFFIYSIAELTRPIGLIILVGFYYKSKFNLIEGYIFCLFITSFIVLCLGLKFFNHLDNTNNHKKLELSNLLTTKRILYYSFPLFLTQIMSLLNNIADRFLLKYYLNIEQVGLYSKAYIFGSSLGLIFDSLILLWVPYVIKNKQLILVNIFPRIEKPILITFSISTFIFIIALLIYFKKSMFFGFSHEFIATFLIVIAAFIFRMGYQVLTPLLSAIDMNIIIAKLSFLTMIFGILINLALIPIIGMVASAIATFISFSSYSVLIYLYFKKIQSTKSIS